MLPAVTLNLLKKKEKKKKRPDFKDNGFFTVGMQ